MSMLSRIQLRRPCLRWGFSLGSPRRDFLSRRRLAHENLEDRTVFSVADYSTFLGEALTDSAFAVAADAAGNSYVTGTTASESFPVTAGSFDGTLNGIYDAFVAKFWSDGTLAWSTF